MYFYCVYLPLIITDDVATTKSILHLKISRLILLKNFMLFINIILTIAQWNKIVETFALHD